MCWVLARKSEAHVHADGQGTESDCQVRTDGLRFVYRQASDSGQAAVQLINLKRRSEDLMCRGNCHAESRPLCRVQAAALETCRVLEGTATCVHGRGQDGRGRAGWRRARKAKCGGGMVAAGVCAGARPE